MSHSRKRNVSRRDFLRLAGTGLAAAGVGSFLQGCAPQPTAAPTAAPTKAPTAAPTAAPVGEDLTMWWWGEQEAVGLELWVQESVELFKEQTGHTVAPTLQDTDVVISQFQTASAANDAPDIQFFWNGSYCLESAWLGYVEPLNDLIPADVLKDSNATVLSLYGGKQYRLGWYGLPMLWTYGKEVFDKAGLNADEPPQDWDSFLDACDKLKTAGFIPCSAGLKDGFWGEWWLGQTLVHDLDSAGQAIDLFLGKLDWREPKYVSHWAKLKELWDAGFLNDDMQSIELYPGIELMMAGKSGMAMTIGGLVPEAQRLLGDDGVGVMIFPYGGEGEWAGQKPIADTQGLGISSQSEHKEEAAEFLLFLQSEERMNALWDGPKQPPANVNFDGNRIKDPVLKKMWSDWMQVDFLPWIPDLMPVMFWSDAMFVNAQNIIAGEWDGEQCAENSYEVTQKWKEQSPDMVEKYEIWKEDLSG